MKPSGPHRHFDGEGVAQVGHFVHPQVRQVEVLHDGGVSRADKDVRHFELAGAVLWVGAAVHPTVCHHDDGRDVAVDESAAHGFKCPAEVGALPVGLPAFRRHLDHISVEAQQSHVPPFCRGPFGQRVDQRRQSLPTRQAVGAGPLGGRLVHQDRQQRTLHRFGVAPDHGLEEQQGEHAQRGQAQQRQQPRGFGAIGAPSVQECSQDQTPCAEHRPLPGFGVHDEV